MRTSAKLADTREALLRVSISLHFSLDDEDERPSRVGSVSQQDIRGDLDRYRGLEHRRLDVQRRLGLAHDEP